MKILMLDSLFDTLDVEMRVARDRSATVERWKGDAEALSDADIVAHVRTSVDADLIARMTRCRVITRFGTGIDTVDLAAAARAGIEVVTVRDYCLPELPAHTLALALALVRRLPETQGLLDRPWEEIANTTPLNRDQEVTVVGFGSVGTRVAAAFDALGFTVSVVTHHARDEAQHHGWRVVQLEQGVAEADVLTLHTRLDDSTRGMIDAPLLGVARSNLVLVNTARLALIDEKAVADALRSERIAGVALDGNLPADSPLRSFETDARLLVTPHLGWYSREAAEALRTAAIADAIDLARNIDLEQEARR